MGAPDDETYASTRGGAEQTASASIVERLARIETKLDVWHETHTDHEGRIRRLERSVWVAMGIAATGGGALSQWIGHAL